MDGQVIGGCVFIMAGRVVDVSLGTLRTVSVVRGRRGVAWCLGFFEILIWVFVVSKVVQNLDQPAYAVSYALGFATGNYIGLTLENWFAFGEQVVRIFTREGPAITAALRTERFRVTSFAGEGRDGPVQLLFIEAPRRAIERVIGSARRIDPTCFYVVDDVRAVSRRPSVAYEPTGWRAVLKK